MEIKNLVDETIVVTDLNAHIEAANKSLGLAWEIRNDKENPQIPYIEREGKKVNEIQFHRHNLKELLKLLPPLKYPDWLGVYTFPCCYSYCDKRKEENGDYKTILRLFYSPLRIEIKQATMKAYPEILELAKEQLRRLKMRINEPLEVSATGQTTGLSLSADPDIVILKN